MASIGYFNAFNWAIDATEVGSLVFGNTTVAQQNQNTLTLQSVLNSGGDLRITVPGTYLFNTTNGPLTIPSNTSLYLGTGVELKTADGSPSALLTNAAARSTGTVVPGANISYAAWTEGGGYIAVLTNLAQATAANFPVGSWISVVIGGEGALGAAGTAWASRGYRGVQRVVKQVLAGAASSISYTIDFIYPGSAPSTNPATIYRADENIRLWGQGIINGNSAAASTAYVTGDPRGVVVWWRHLTNIVVEDIRFRRGVTWTMGSNYVRNYTVTHIGGDTRLPVGQLPTADLVHLSGNHQQVLVDTIDIGCEDNPIGMTIDCTIGTLYNFPYQNPGDMTDIIVRNVCTATPGGMIAMYGPAAYWYRNIFIDNPSGASGSAALQLSNYAPTNQNKLSIDSLTFANARTYANVMVECLTANVEIGTLLIENVLTPREDIRAIQFGPTCSGTIRSLILRNVNTFPANNVNFTRTVPLVTFGGMNITALAIANSEVIVLAANVKAFEADGTGNIGKVGIRDCSATGTGTAAVWGDTGAGTAAVPVYNNATYNGVAL